MAIINKTIKISCEGNISNDVVEQYFAQQNLSVVRWAIVGVNEHEFTLSVAIVV